MIGRRKKRQRDEEQRMPTTLDTPVENPPSTPPEEILRAEQAAALGALSLEQARARRSEVDRTVAEIRRLNRDNGFAEMISKAFGS